jgi:lysozyme family protein
VQSQIGVEADGRIGPKTTAAIRDYRNRLEEQKKQLSIQLEQINNTSVVKTARQEIQKIRSETAKEIADSNQLINRLRSQLGQTQKQNVDQLIESQRNTITRSNQELDTLIEKKYQLETEFRKLEAEVGPIKYIAQFIYGQDADKNLLEKAVTWVIILLVLVFDPLAIVLLLASQLSFQNFRQNTTASNFLDFNFKNYSFLTDPVINQTSNKTIHKDIEKDLENIQKNHKSIKQAEIVEKPPVPVFQKQESKNVKIKVFKRAENSTATVITPEIYQSISKDKFQEGNK